MTAFGPCDPADADDFARLLREQLPRCARLAVRLCGDVHAAEDLVGEAMLRATRARTSFRGESSFGTWLYAILINVFRDSLRSRDSARPMLRLAGHEPPDARPSILESALAAELGGRIAQRISALPPRQREAIVLTVYEGLDAEQAAAAMQTTATNVRVLVHHARTRLKQELAQVVEIKDARR